MCAEDGLCRPTVCEEGWRAVSFGEEFNSFEFHDPLDACLGFGLADILRYALEIVTQGRIRDIDVILPVVCGCHDLLDVRLGGVLREAAG
jgi:hypothetical protein